MQGARHGGPGSPENFPEESTQRGFAICRQATFQFGVARYAAIAELEGTVDHFLSVKHHRHLSYEWRNYRYVSASINASKQNADDTVLDPYEVGDGWFEIILPSLQLRVTDRVPKALRAKAEFTLKRLKLRDGEKVIRQRQAWYRLYCEGKLSLDGLRVMAPLIADAVRRQTVIPP